MSATRYLAGALLVGSSTSGLGWMGWLGVRGQRVSNAPFETWPQLSPLMRRTVWTWIAAHLLSLAGFAVLTTTVAPDDPGLGVIALVLLTISVIFVVLEGTHHITLGIWSAERYVEEGTRPEFTIPLAIWANQNFSGLYYVLGLIALGLYGGTMAVTGVPARWVGWITIGWSGLWLVVLVLRRSMWTWALLTPVQLLVGVVLLSQSSN